MKQDAHQLFENIRSMIDTHEDHGNPFFGDKRYKPYPLDRNNFHGIGNKPCESRVCFIDAGQAEIISGTSLVFGICRAYAGIFSGMRKENFLVSEFYVVSRSFVKQDEICYASSVLPIRGACPDEHDLTFNAHDTTMKEGIFMFSISKMLSACRRFAEWVVAKQACTLLGKDDMLVMDGSLQTGITNEWKYAEAAYNAAKAKGVLFSALSKTSSLFTTTGSDLLSAISSMQNNGKWYYHPIADIISKDHRAEMAVVKLHQRGSAFRFELLKDQARMLHDAVALLALHAADYRLPGYPYGLMDAHRSARIMEHEKTHSQIFAAGFASGSVREALNG